MFVFVLYHYPVLMLLNIVVDSRWQPPCKLVNKDFKRFNTLLSYLTVVYHIKT